MTKAVMFLYRQMIALTIHLTLCNAIVQEINQMNVDEFLKGKLFALTFVDSPSCSRCRKHFPFFVAASQSFPDDPEIFFTRTYDKDLIQDWGVEELPALVYHREGLSKHEIIHVDVTVDDVVEAIARTLHGNFGGLTRTYCVHLDDRNYDEFVVTPKQSVLLLLHGKDEESEADLDAFEKVAHAFRKDDAILFATLDVSKHQDVRDERFKSRDTPSIIWLPVEDKTKPRRFGGVHSAELLTTFINERTGLNRNMDGSMQPEAGLITKAETLLQEHMGLILSTDTLTLKQVKESLLELKETEAEHHQEMLKYYMYIVDKIANTGGTGVIDEMVSALDRTLFGKEEKSTRTEETLKRRGNVLQSFQEKQRNFLEAKAKDAESVEPGKEDSLPESKMTLRTAHIHTEL